MYTGSAWRAGLGVLPAAIVATAAKLLVPAIESLFKSNSSYSYPATKTMIDDWAGTINLDPTLITANAQWAWANVRCLAGDSGAESDMAAAAALFPLKQIGGGMQMRFTPNGPVPDGFAPSCTNAPADAAQYALTALRVLTARKDQPKSDLYSGTMPPPIVDDIAMKAAAAKAVADKAAADAAAAAAGKGTIAGIPTWAIAGGVGVVALLIFAGRR